MSTRSLFPALLTGALMVVGPASVGATVRIMPLGDSITRGCCPSQSGCDLGYRYPLYEKLLAEGLDVDFVGSQQHPQDACSVHGVPTDFDRDHEGYYGRKADGVRDNIYGTGGDWLTHNPADIVLLEIGTNDLLSSESISSTLDEIGEILQKVNLYATQHSRIVHVTTVAVVDMEHDPGFVYEFEPLGDFRDDAQDVHPVQPIDDDSAEKGYEKMVAVWYEALKPYFRGAYNEWTSRTSGAVTGENLYGVVRGPGTYVAVGDLGTIVTSPDGVSWTRRDAGTYFGLKEVVYANGGFVAVGDHATVATSPDGLTWATGNIAGVTDRDFYGLAYGNGSFVAVGNTGTLLVSSDGVTWSSRQLATTGQLHDVAYGNGMFVAVGNDHIASSSDLTTWNYFANARNDGVAYGNGRFVVVGSDGSVEVSSDGTTWTERNLGSDKSLFEVTYGNGTFLAVGHNGAIVTSSDGAVWAPKSSRTNRWLWGVTIWEGSALPVAVGNLGTIIQRSYAPGDDCGAEMVMDCFNSCYEANHVGDGQCDASPHPNFDCIEFDFDGGDCAHPAGVVLAFDSSGSMAWTHEGQSTTDPDQQRITLAKRATYAFLELLEDYAENGTNFGISRFPTQPWSSTTGCSGQVVTPMTLVDGTSIGTAVATTVPGLTTGGSTPLLAGIEKALGMFGTESDRAIVLLSDGYHNCPAPVGVNDPSVTSLIAELDAKRVKLFTIGFGRPTDVDHALLETLAEETGGRFYDVTDAAFDPVSWDPATGLQDAYKGVLVDALGLQSPADPHGIIRGGGEIVREVPMSGHDRQVSFFLSWVTPQRGRLGLKVVASDGTELPELVSAPPGVRIHEGRTYTILTLDQGFLSRSGKVGPTPWRLIVDAGQLGEDEEEKYQYSVILDSGLKMETGFDRTDYRTGEAILLSARLTAGSKPVGAATVEVDVSRPQDGAGNWFHVHGVTDGELAEVPGERDGEVLSDLQRKATYLTDVRGAAFPGRLVADRPLRLHDDGSHGDATPGDGVYTRRYTDTVRDGTYSFFFRARGEAAAGAFVREAGRETHVSVGVSPDHLAVQVERLKDVERMPRYQLMVTPRDALGNYLGPRHGRSITLAPSRGRLVSELRDDLSGSYVQVLELPRGVDPVEVDVGVHVDEVSSSFNLGEETGQRFAASLHLGTAVPSGTFNGSYDADWSAALDLEARLTTDLSLVGVLGYSRFAAAVSGVGDTDWWNLSGMLKYEIGSATPRPFAEVGAGLYAPKSGSVEPGASAGIGVRFDPTPGRALELAADYHRIFTSSGDVEYWTPQLRWSWRF